MEKIRLMLVDDHLLMRQGTRELLEREQDLEIVAEAGDGEEAVRLANRLRPDVILMDIALPALSGVEATERIKATCPETAVLVLSAYDDDAYIFAVLEAGAAGYLLKDVSIQELTDAVRAVHAGESVLHSVVTRKVIDYFAHQAADRGHEERQDRMSGPLTERELEVLQLAARGETNREIAIELSISPRTVQVHLSNIFGRLGVGSRTEAVLYAVREGWLSLEDMP